MVDRVIVLVDGQISEMGTYEELLSHEGAFAQFLNAYFTEVKEEDEEVDLDNDPEGETLSMKTRYHILYKDKDKSKML